jgi:predicted  nucleic acid-binding Zn-ribbon protein
MNEPYASLLQLQDLDQEIARAQARVEQFSPRLAELRASSMTIERELEQTRSKLEELRTQARKLELGAENKREKLRLYQERVEKARNIRDEAATRTEMDLIRRAVEAEVAESQDTNDQVRRHDMRVDELEKTVAKAREEIRPQEEQIQSEHTEAEQALRILQDKRGNHVLHMDKAAVRLYERVRAGKRKTALAPLTADGACGICYNVLPMQEQSEIRQGKELRRCEACGVILYPPDA